MAKTRAQAPKVSKASPAPPPAAAAPTYFAPDDAAVRTRTVPYKGGEPAFYLYFQPGCWYLKEGKILPRLSKLSRIGGQCNVGQTRVRSAEGRYSWIPDMSLAFAQLHQTNATVVPHNVDEDDGFPSYLREIPGLPGKYCHRLCELVPGMTPRPPAPGVWAEWLESLMERGVLPRPHAAEVAKVVGAAVRLAEQHEKADEPRHAKSIRAQLAQLAASESSTDG
jgi:hypothetical protein